MTRLWLYGDVGALAVAAEAVDEKAADDAQQAEHARADRSAMEIENARLRSIPRERGAHAETGRHCLEPRDVDGLRDDCDAIFGERLQAGREPDSAE